MSKTTIVAEPGCTAEGDLTAMMHLIDVAADAGCDVFKAQWTSNPHRMAERRSALAFEPSYAWLAFPADWHDALGHKCAVRGMNYACSVYLPEDVPVIAPYVSAIKVSSFESGDRALLQAAVQTARPVWVSMGMVDEDTVRAAQRRWPEVTTWLHCVSSYPTPVDQLNLKVIGPLFKGFSDHSVPWKTWTGSVAAARGATLVEAHIRLVDADPTNPDVPHAMTSQQFREYVRGVRDPQAVVVSDDEVAMALGDGVKQTMPCEAEMTRYRVEDT